MKKKAVDKNQIQLDFGGVLGWVCGVDEVGRGPLAGPVVAAAVILDPNRPIDGLADSKILSPERRAELDILIRARAFAYAIGRAEVEEIDELNILQASLLAMQRAVAALHTAPDLAYIDGNRCPVLRCRAEAIIGGDATVPAISAASIIAKVARDLEMVQWDTHYQVTVWPNTKAIPRRCISVLWTRWASRPFTGAVSRRCASACCSARSRPPI